MVEQQEPTAYVNPYKFNAKELDSETGLYYYGARYYNPRLSIWYGVDPLAVYNPVMETQFYGDGQHNGGVYNFGNLNPYIYCYQNPIKYLDPNGKQVNTTAGQDIDNAESVISMTFGVIGDARAGVLNLLSRARGTNDRFKGDGFTGYYKVPKANADGVFWDFYNVTIGVLAARYGVSSGTLLSVKQGVGTLTQLREVIQATKALSQYSKYGKCVEFANAFKKAYGGSIYEIKANYMSLLQNGKEIPITDNGMHRIVEKVIDGKSYIFDNMNPKGVLRSDYEKMLEGANVPGKPISGQNLLRNAKEIK
ncbi:RHS repeat-associated core domain-containing protein [Chryseobacterium profundimaris]|uniref:RHS repeat-associated core domain-containing protein n=2 Tax=Chryseobacterium profundimaris TaxID=1387275 RepID=A0ABY1PJW8_9FLAO|nr:RHS repeat-associated core domain-containing protein [Chryseobacterium profundimaris]